jgi:prolyl-tRNA editing enzyme YbaK/EbsC (Cys-tRNA(Pro) deacylase)
MRAFTLNKGLKPPSQNPFAVVLDIAVRLTPEEKLNRLTGFENNAVTPIGMSTDIPVSPE